MAGYGAALAWTAGHSGVGGSCRPGPFVLLGSHRIQIHAPPARVLVYGTTAMKIRNSLKSLMKRHRDNQLVRRKGRVFIINKTQKRFKARQG